ncbi:hypothetical protein PWT90_11210 [Aphanocladium album]|nr:hypothetical protein PWT90_11210 [Aphanocladium album]
MATRLDPAAAAAAAAAVAAHAAALTIRTECPDFLEAKDVKRAAITYVARVDSEWTAGARGYAEARILLFDGEGSMVPGYVVEAGLVALLYEVACWRFPRSTADWAAVMLALLGHTALWLKSGYARDVLDPTYLRREMLHAFGDGDRLRTVTASKVIEVLERAPVVSLDTLRKRSTEWRDSIWITRWEHSWRNDVSLQTATQWRWSCGRLIEACNSLTMACDLATEALRRQNQGQPPAYSE